MFEKTTGKNKPGIQFLYLQMPILIAKINWNISWYGLTLLISSCVLDQHLDITNIGCLEKAIGNVISFLDNSNSRITNSSHFVGIIEQSSNQFN